MSMIKSTRLLDPLPLPKQHPHMSSTADLPSTAMGDAKANPMISLKKFVMHDAVSVQPNPRIALFKLPLVVAALVLVVLILTSLSSSGYSLLPWPTDLLGLPPSSRPPTPTHHAPSPPPPPYSCAWAFVSSSRSSPPACACSITACAASPDTCCPDFPRVSHVVTSYLVKSGAIHGPLRRDLGNNMTVAWEMSQWRRTSWGAVLVVGQECVRYVLAGKHKWECADQAHVVEVNARVEPGWVNYTVSAYTPPKGKHVPGEMVVGFGSTRMQRPKYRPALPSDLFYLRLRDPGSIEAVLQSVTARLRYCGLSLSLDVRGRNGGAPWDPTPNRDWHALSGSRYSLTRGGASPIEYDASPSGVDAEYEKVVRESGGQVVPWLACQVRRIHMGGEWVDVVDRATGEWVDVQDDGMWFW